MSTGWIIGYVLLWAAVFALGVVLFQALKIIGMFITKVEKIASEPNHSESVKE